VNCAIGYLPKKYRKSALENLDDEILQIVLNFYTFHGKKQCNNYNKLFKYPTLKELNEFSKEELVIVFKMNSFMITSSVKIDLISQFIENIRNLGETLDEKDFESKENVKVSHVDIFFEEVVDVKVEKENDKKVEVEKVNTEIYTHNIKFRQGRKKNVTRKAMFRSRLEKIEIPPEPPSLSRQFADGRFDVQYPRSFSS
jgi:hypothetical protein